MKNREGWVKITDRLSEFHKQLINAIPKYSSIAVSEMMLPARIEDLPLDERRLLQVKPNCALAMHFRGEKLPAPPTHVDEEPSLLLGDVGQSAKFGPADLVRFNYDVLDIALKRSPAFQELCARKAAVAKRPIIKRQPVKAVDKFFEVAETHEAGERKMITVEMQHCYFRCEKFKATDSLDGTGTKIAYIMVGNKVQRQGGARTLNGSWVYIPTPEFVENCRVEQRNLDTCQPPFNIYIMVEFLKKCEFRAKLTGKAVV